MGAHHRLHELVGHPPVIGALHRSCRIVRKGSIPKGDGVVGPSHPVPAVIPVHGIVAAHDGGDPAHPHFLQVILKPLDKPLARGGGHIPPIQETVNPYPVQAPIPGHAQQRKQVLDVGVYTAVAEQPEQVQRRSFLLAVVHDPGVGGVLEKAPLLDVQGDPGQVLEHHPARADVGVAHLAVAHLPFGQSHVQTGGGQAAKTVPCKKPVQVWRVSRGNGVVPRPGGIGKSKAVQNDQCDWFLHTLAFLSNGGA